MSQRRRELFHKHWAIVRALQQQPRGLSRQRLIDKTGIPSTTLHRCIGELRDFGIPIETRTRNGEAWHCLDALSLPPLTLTAVQLMTLRIARKMIGALEGTVVARELDALLAPHKLREAAGTGVTLGKAQPVAPEILDTLDRAITQRRRVRIRVYTRNKPELHDRFLDPLCLRCTGGTMYLVGFDRDKRDYRSFKVARIAQAQKLTEQATTHAAFDEDEFFKNAIKVGSGPVLEVAIRFSRDVAKVLREYPPLPSQTLTDHADGSVTLRAEVAGLQEALRWTLAWGKDAEVLEPGELRDAIRRELSDAAGRYERSARGNQHSEVGVRAGVSTDRGSRVR